MYNRYIPGADGSYHCHPVAEPIAEAACPPDPAPREHCPPPVQDQPASCPPRERKQQQTLFGMDLGDLLLLAVILLLLLDAEESETLPLLLTAAAFVLLQ